MTEHEPPPQTEERPAKRVRLESPEPKPQDDGQLQKELKAGITAYVSPDIPGFSGVLKQRYTDFLVNEILLNGRVLHFDGDHLPKSDGGQENNSGVAESKSGDEKQGALNGTAETQIKGEKKATSNDVATVQSNKAEQGPGRGTATAADQKNKEVVNMPEEKLTAAAVQEAEGRITTYVNEQGEEVSFQVTTDDVATLESLFGKDTTMDIMRLHSKVLKERLNPGKPDTVRRKFILTAPIESKDDRTRAHQSIRRVFNSKLESSTGNDNSIRITVAAKPNLHKRDSAGRGLPPGKLGWQQLGGEYLHFTLYKENKDTMEVMYYLASQLKMHVKNFAFAGTKDRRGVTVQRVSAYRVQAERLKGLNRSLRNARVGGFQYERSQLSLGDLTGNEFVITLRECHFEGEHEKGLKERIEIAKSVLETTVKNLQQKGFLNYYGLQRFGSFSTGTDEIGKALLKGDFKAAVHLILQQSPETLAAAQGKTDDTSIASDDRKRALALDRWNTTGNLQQALELMPKKFSAEVSILRHIGVEKNGNKVNRNDFQGALLTIQRNLRLMYVHAYQSLVWNVVAGKRWELFGDRVVEGDLVIAEAQNSAHEEVDADGEVVVRPEGEDRAVNDGDYEKGRPLSKEEVESGKFSIFDVVLPLPGYDVVYPPNEVGAFYKEFMGSERGGGLDPNSMRRKQKDYSLSGGYRKLMARPAPGMTWEVKLYRDETEQLVDTDLVKAKDKAANGIGSERQLDEHEAQRLAVVLRLQLGASQYATMALRELMKGGVKSYKADFGRGGE